MRYAARLLLLLVLCFTFGIALSSDQVPVRLRASATSFTPPVIERTHMLIDVGGQGIGSHLGIVTFFAPHDLDLTSGTYVSNASITAETAISYTSSRWASSSATLTRSATG